MRGDRHDAQTRRTVQAQHAADGAARGTAKTTPVLVRLVKSPFSGAA